LAILVTKFAGIVEVLVPGVAARRRQAMAGHQRHCHRADTWGNYNVRASRFQLIAKRLIRYPINQLNKW
jgi:hypothetical protein